ncbi:MAG: hypothetical protein CM1200mP27_04670 [Chloroflexota bacterium]|nr:MAG: hypothetical protein CM1200mP27_04670 [Chloroflexota bacterium]
MSIESVAILSPGDMGHAIGQLLRENELHVLTCLAGRAIVPVNFQNRQV